MQLQLFYTPRDRQFKESPFHEIRELRRKPAGHLDTADIPGA
jgi:hypothetical protein